MVNLSEISAAFRKDEVQSPDQTGCGPESLAAVVGFLGLMVAAWFAGFHGVQVFL